MRDQHGLGLRLLVLSAFAPDVMARLGRSASLCSLQDGEHGSCATEMEQAAAISGDVLVVAIATAEKGAELVVASAEPIRGVECLEAAHTSDPAFHAPMILLQPIVLVGAG